MDAPEWVEECTGITESGQGQVEGGACVGGH